MRNIFAVILVVSQVLILLPSQAQVVRESDQKTDNSVSISAENIPNQNTTLPATSSDAPQSSDRTEIIVSESDTRPSAVVTKPSSRIPIFSKIFNHPSMQQ